MDTTEECYLLWNHVVRAKQHKGTFVSVYLCCGRSPTVSHTQQNNACVHRGWLCVLCVVVISFMAAVWNHNCSSLRCHILTWLSRWDGEDTVHRVQFLLKKIQRLQAYFTARVQAEAICSQRDVYRRVVFHPALQLLLLTINVHAKRSQADTRTCVHTFHLRSGSEVKAPAACICEWVMSVFIHDQSLFFRCGLPSL